MTTYDEPSTADAELFGNRFLTREVPTRDFPADGMSAADRQHPVRRERAARREE